MNIAIIGTGNVGGALAKGWSKAGHKIHLGVRDTSKFKGIDLLDFSTNISVHTISEAVMKSEVIVVAATPEATLSIIAQLGDINGKTIVDSMNNIRSTPEGYKHTFEAFSALCKGAQVVKCFNTTGFENMLDPNYNGTGIDMFMAGDSQTAKEIVATLAKDLGFENCYNFGGSDKVMLLEQFAMGWINLAIMQGYGRNIALKLIKR